MDISLKEYMEFVKLFVFTFEDSEGNIHKIYSGDSKAMDEAMNNPDWHIIYDEET